MKALITFILGILGLASIAGGAFVALSGGGLVSELKTHDSELQSLDESKRAKVLETWVAEVNAGAEGLSENQRRASIGPSIGDVQKEILSTLSKAETKFDALSKAWNESEAETKKAESALKETEADFTKAEQNFDKLSPEQKASIKKDAEAVSEAIDESFSKEQVADNPAMQERLNRVRKVLDRLKQAE